MVQAATGRPARVATRADPDGGRGGKGPASRAPAVTVFALLQAAPVTLEMHLWVLCMLRQDAGMLLFSWGTLTIACAGPCSYAIYNVQI